MKVYLSYNYKFKSDTIVRIRDILKIRRFGIVERIPINKLEIKKIIQSNESNLLKSDLVIIEYTYKSTYILYEASISIANKKPVIIIYNSDTISKPHAQIKTLQNNPSRYLLVKKYTTSTLEMRLSEALEEARNLMQTKFLLILPPHIDQYLEWNVKRNGLSKADVTRQALETIMSKDIEYQKYLEELNSSE
ncbi:MAG: TIR domain-containing protein [Candidatus Dojkabacteria bacterium]|nr:TIR domain-containing protein [Candidatus Dojkabacteria bacterium]